ncbi:MAG: hypothetical protein M1524_01955 [Patescibacteria group bacterium]|nr:hypothetical protein [Patescibacteria group bacterium]
MKDFLLSIRKKQKQNNKYVIPFLILVFITVVFFDFQIKKQTTNNPILSYNFIVPTQAPYPIVNSVLGATNGAKLSTTQFYPDLSAEAAIIIDDDSKVVLFEKNANFRFSAASTTKIMTALVALDYFKPGDIITIFTENIEGSNVGFKKGERYFFEDILYGMLLPSGNDAAVAIAQNYPGGEKEFVKKMNKKAESLYLRNTNFGDPTGLFDGDDYTTALDLARLSSVAIKNTFIASIVSTKYKTIKDLDGNKIHNVENLNKLLGLDGVNGIKTGFTDEAKGVLATSRVENGHLFIIVVMKSQDRFADTKKLIDLISGRVTHQAIRF